MKAKARSAKPSKKGGEQHTDVSAPMTVARGNSETADKPKRKRGVKTAKPELAKLIEMANLAGDGNLEYDHFKNSAWESTAGLLSAIMQLDDPLRSDLLHIMTAPEEGPWTTADMVKAGWNAEYASLAIQAQMVSTQYHLIRSARKILERVVAGEVFFPAEVFIERRVDKKGRHKARFYTSETIQPLIDADDLKDIRRCSVCRKFFFARRASSAVCEPDSPCAATYSKRQERANKKRREELAGLKKKRAKTARKR